MHNEWRDGAAPFADPLDEAVAGSRLLGSNADLVLHGGGNSSIKGTVTDVTGREVDVLFVKGSGWDLGTIERPGFAALRMERLRELLTVEVIPDPILVNELRCALIDASAPDPSIEALLHALLPHRAVLHSHADTIVTLTNQPEPEAHVHAVFGDSVLVVPYVKPGFDLARLCAVMWQEQGRDDLVGIVLLNHGLFTFGDTMQEAYARHVDLLTRAEAYLTERGAVVPTGDPSLTRKSLPVEQAHELASFRKQLSAAAGRPMVVSASDADTVDRFLSREDAAHLATRGPATPDHIIRTKRLPLIGRDVDSYVADYEEYFETNKHRAHEPLEILDPTPRIVLDDGWSLVTVGKTLSEADQVRDIAVHTLNILTAGEALGSYAPLDAGQLFDIEYWDLEQAKLRKAGKRPALQGQTAVVTGAASGIGRGCVAALLEAGANVVGIDVSDSVADTFSHRGWLGLQVDVRDEGAVERALAEAASRFGGVDMLIAAAGVFAQSAPIVDVSADEWKRTMSINVDAMQTLFAAAHPYLARAVPYGRATLVGSKNLAAPGPGASAYSASKAAATQLARVAALEWASDGIRVNVVHPDAVFDTALWTEELLAERASKYGLTVDEYKRRNLLSTEVTSDLVGRLVATMNTEVFQATTGSQIPIDGGNERVV
ncbi:bifunctional aldolase/short-chain dehydrogenase [Microbacterium sp. A204]|uniref:bifunctional aldolase/short-chain dehydrogenase n=1 Tax=Microbacterium sp. A204 TaxID=3457321 RepID=UPI003FCF7DF5